MSYDKKTAVPSSRYRKSKEEMETIFAFDRASSTARIYTADEAYMREMDGYCEKSPLVVEKKRDEYGRWYECPKSYLTLQLPRELSDEQRNVLRERARQNFGHVAKEG